MKDIEQYLRDNRPETPAEGQFLIETNARLNAVEGIKKEVDGSRRRGRVAVLVTLIAGLKLGCFLAYLAIRYPIQSFLPDNSALSKILATLQDNKSILFFLIASFAIVLGVLSINRERETI